MAHTTWIIGAALAALLHQAPASAQTPAGGGPARDGPVDGGPAEQIEPGAADGSRTLVAGSLGMGVGSLGIGGLLSLGVGTSVGDFVIRSAATEEWSFLGPSESVSDVAVLYGGRASSEAGSVRIAAGPALVQAEEVGQATNCAFIFCDHERIRTTTAGLAAQGDAVWAISSWFGLGATVFANVNTARSFAGATVTVSLGAVR